jgi:prevent-host-death family protein
MKMVGAFEAKTHLSSLLREVRKGEEIIISKHGQPIARLLPYKKETGTADITTIIQEIKQEQSKHRLGDSTIKQLIEEGRE